MRICDYQSWGEAGARIACEQPPILEFFKGTQVVRWWGMIERQVKDKIDKYEATNNPAYADKLRAFLQVWQDNPLTGSINVEDVNALFSAASVEAADPWSEGNYFSNLRDSLNVLKASEEELPRAGEMPKDSMLGGGGQGAMFGPEKEPGSLGGPPPPPGPETPAPGEAEGATHPDDESKTGKAIDKALGTKPAL